MFCQTLDGSKMTERTPQGEFPSQPPVSYEAPVDRGPEVVATSLAPQLGSDTIHLSKGIFDMRKLSFIEERDIPFLIYCKIRGKKAAVWKDIYNLYLNLQVSVGGKGMRNIIRMEGVSKGGLPDMQPEYDDKPGFFQRNFSQRDWRKKAKEDMI